MISLGAYTRAISHTLCVDVRSSGIYPEGLPNEKLCCFSEPKGRLVQASVFVFKSSARTKVLDFEDLHLLVHSFLQSLSLALPL